MHQLVWLAGLGHLALGVGSLLIPRLLDWSAALAQVPVLIRQMFWTYAGYILGINLFFGLVSLLYPEALLSGAPLARALTLLITVYWLTRLIIQFVYFDRSEVPDQLMYRVGEVALNLLFVFFTAVYGWATWHNFSA